MNTYEKHLIEIQLYYKNKYADELKRYLIINNRTLDDIMVGDVIRYVKRDLTLSVACIIKKIVKHTLYKNKIDYFLVSSIRNKNLWKVYPNNYIFRLHKSIPKNDIFKDVCTKIYEKNNKEYKKTSYDKMKSLGITDKEITTFKQVDKILNNKK